MKRLLSIIALIVPLMASAQFDLTAEGFKSANDKNYYVLEAEGSQSELFSKAKTAITQVFVSAKDVASYNEPDVISLKGFTNDIIIKSGLFKYQVDTNYTMRILFKDGRVRFDAPDVLNMTSRNGKNSMQVYMGAGGGGNLVDFGHVFKKDGKVRYKEVKETLDAYFNSLINAIADKIKSPAVDEDW